MMEPCPSGVKPAEWKSWTEEQRYVYLERVGMDASEATALREARRVLTKTEQAVLFDPASL